MRILLINWQDIKNPLGGGAEVHMHEIFKRIVKMGHEVTLLCCKFDGAPALEYVDGIKVIRVGSRDTFNFRVSNEYCKLLQDELFDIVIDDINKIPFYTPIFVRKPLLAISHHFFGKSIFREAGYVKGSYVYLAEKMVDRVYKKTPFVVVSQSTLDEFLKRGFNKSNFSIVQNAITPEDFPMKVMPKYDVPTVTYFGRLKKYKSVDHLFRAFAIVAEKMPTAELHILGKGDFMPQLKKLAEELKISDKTKFFGYITEEEKIIYLGLSHCVVNTSMKEGWGITNIEANACGTPVVSADVPGLRDSISNNVSGLLYEYGNILQLAERISSVFSCKDLRNRLSEGAVSWAKTFSWDKSAVQMLDRCNEVVSSFKRKLI